MSLSVCMFTSDPPPLVASTLDALRPVADEIVVAYDERVDPTTLGPVAVLADRLVRVEVGPPYLERALGWLLAQCSSEWVFRLDGDEVPSRALLERLGALDAADEGQLLPSIRWLYPDWTSWIHQDPWAPSHAIRVMRNHATFTEVEGVTHSDVALRRPHAHVDDAIYHAALLLDPIDARREKAARYETGRPGHRTRSGLGMETYYVPEDLERVDTRPVPEDDLGLLEVAARAVRAEPSNDESLAGLDVVPLSEIDEHWPQREMGDPDYRADVEVVDVVVAPTIVSAVVSVHNPTAHTWFPAAGIGLGARMLVNGEVHGEEARAGLPSPIRPGARVLIPVSVARDGASTLEVGLVRDGVRWFDGTVQREIEET